MYLHCFSVVESVIVSTVDISHMLSLVLQTNAHIYTPIIFFFNIKHSSQCTTHCFIPVHRRIYVTRPVPSAFNRIYFKQIFLSHVICFHLEAFKVPLFLLAIELFSIPFQENRYTELRYIKLMQVQLLVKLKSWIQRFLHTLPAFLPAHLPLINP